jgi:hypothetical protein
MAVMATGHGDMRAVAGRAGLGLAGLGLILALRAVADAAAEPPASPTSGPQAADHAGRFRSEAGRFEVDMPGTPTIVSTSRRTLGGRVSSTKYYVERDAFEFRVEHHDLPGMARIALSVGGILGRAKNDFLAAVGGRERGFVEAPVQGNPGRALTFEIPGDRPLLGEGLLALVGNRLYVVAAMHRAGDPSSGSVGRLVETFTVWTPTPR